MERGVPPDAVLRGILLEYVYALRSVTWEKLQQSQNSLEDLRRAVNVHPTSVLTRPQLVETLMARELREEAAAVGLAHLEQAPLDVVIRVRLLENDLRRGEVDRARGHLAAALRIASVFCDQELVERLRLLQRRLFEGTSGSAAAQPA